MHIVVSVLVNVAHFVRSRWCLLNFVCSKNKQHPTAHCGGVKEERSDAQTQLLPLTSPCYSSGERTASVFLQASKTEEFVLSLYQRGHTAPTSVAARAKQ